MSLSFTLDTESRKELENFLALLHAGTEDVEAELAKLKP